MVIGDNMNNMSESDKQVLNGYIEAMMEYNYIMYGSVCEFARVASSEHLNWFVGDNMM